MAAATTPSKQQRKKNTASAATGTGTGTLLVVFWCGVSVLSAVSIVFLNKVLLRAVPAPTFLSACHLAFMAAVMEIAAKRGTFKPRKMPPNLRTLQVALVVGAALAPAVSNWSLQLNSVGTSQLFKTLQTPCVAAGEYVWQGKSTTWRHAAALCGVCAGVAAATVTDVELTIMGVVAAFAAIAVSAFYKVSTSKLQQSNVGGAGQWDSLALMHCIIPPGTAILLALSLLTERDGLRKLVEGGDHATAIESDGGNGDPLPRLAAMLCGSCCLAFLVTISQYKIVAISSALTVNLAGQLKTALVIAGGYAFFGTNASGRQVGGATLALASFFLYTRLPARKVADPTYRSKKSSDHGNGGGNDDDDGIDNIHNKNSEQQGLLVNGVGDNRDRSDDDDNDDEERGALSPRTDQHQLAQRRHHNA